MLLFHICLDLKLNFGISFKDPMIQVCITHSNLPFARQMLNYPQYIAPESRIVIASTSGVSESPNIPSRKDFHEAV